MTKAARKLVGRDSEIDFDTFEGLFRGAGSLNGQLSSESLRAAFDEADMDKSGTIDSAEVETLIASLLT